MLSMVSQSGINQSNTPPFEKLYFFQGVTRGSTLAAFTAKSKAQVVCSAKLWLIVEFL